MNNFCAVLQRLRTVSPKPSDQLTIQRVIDDWIALRDDPELLDRLGKNPALAASLSAIIVKAHAAAVELFK